MPVESTLEILRYVAIVIAAASGIWALLHKLFDDDATGRRRLTRAGRIALTLMIAGAAVGVGSLWLQGRLGEESKRSADLEARIGAPLTQLEVGWTFEQARALRVDVEPCREFELRTDHLYPRQYERPRKCDVAAEATRRWRSSTHSGCNARCRWRATPAWRKA
jgi:hypothetical protein